MKKTTGLAKARAKGKKLGRPEIKINEDQIKKLRSDGWSIRKIANELNISKSLVGRVSATF